MLSDNLLSDNITVYDNMLSVDIMVLSDNVMLSDNIMLCFFMPSPLTHGRIGFLAIGAL
jgi:hypothetical protein